MDEVHYQARKKQNVKHNEENVGVSCGEKNRRRKKSFLLQVALSRSQSIIFSCFVCAANDYFSH